MTVPPPPGSSAAQPVTYATGSWVAFVLDDLALLLELTPDSRLLEQCWSIAAAGQGLDAVLATITRPGPQAVANFAAVARTADGTRVVVAGSARGEIGGTPLTTDGGATRDERVPGRPPVRLTSDAGVGAEAAVLPLVSGIAPASAIGVGVGPVAAAAAPGAAAPTAAAAPVVPPPDAPRPVDPVPVPRVSNDTMPPASVFDSGIIESLPWRGTGEEPTAGDEPAPPPPPPPPPPPAAPSWNDPFAAGPGGGVADASQHNLWGAPSQPAWPDPNPQPAQQPAPDSSPEPVPGTPPGGGWGAPGAPGAPAAGANPWAPPGATAAEEMNPAAVAPVDETSGPIVHAFTCPRGHLNPPYAGTCRICDEPIAAQEGFAVPRPSLGVLKLSTGDTVPLDRDVVLGRAPFHADESAASRPHLVQLSSPGNDISRSHVRVNLENWFVQVTDLGSTNGTVVTLPDQAPVRLRPHDPFTILPGTTVNIADEVTLRYEVS